MPGTVADTVVSSVTARSRMLPRLTAARMPPVKPNSSASRIAPLAIDRLTGKAWATLSATGMVVNQLVPRSPVAAPEIQSK